MNNRLLEFRVWDSKHKLFCDRLYNAFCSPKEEGAVCLDEIIRQNEEGDKRFVIQQFTGLSDKNGKKIFEGDIIIYLCDKKVRNLVVKFHNGAFIAVLKNHLDKDNPSGFYQLAGIKDYLLVKGNIFENPKLLK